MSNLMDGAQKHRESCDLLELQWIESVTIMIVKFTIGLGMGQTLLDWFKAAEAAAGRVNIMNNRKEMRRHYYELRFGQFNIEKMR